MTKSRLASFLDSCLITCCVVFITLLTLNKLKVPLILKLLICAVLGSITFILYSKREKKRYKNQQLKLRDKAQFNLTILKIELMSTSEKKEYFKELFKRLKSTLTENNSNISYNIYSLTNNSKPIDTSLSQNIIDSTKNTAFDNYYVIILESDIKTQLIEKYAEIEQKNITFLYPEDLYAMIKKLNYLPDISGLEKTKTPFKENFKIMLSNLMYKRNSKSFFISALLLIFSSLFVPFKAYYHTIAIILLTLCITCLIFGKKTANI